MGTFLVTGANRGIGLGFTRQLLQDGHRVLACCRNPDGARDLWEVESDYKDRMRIFACDIADPTSVDTLAKALQEEKAIDCLINNAGVLEEGGLGLKELSLVAVQKSLEVNVIGTMRITKAVLPLLEKATKPVIANISSKMGSIADNSSGGYYAYRMAKAGLNMFGKSLAVDFPKIITVTLHPGWVQTAMGGANALIEVQESVKGLCGVIYGIKSSLSGHFLDYKGQEIPW